MSLIREMTKCAKSPVGFSKCDNLTRGLLTVFLALVCAVRLTAAGPEMTPICDESYLPQLEQMIESASSSIDIVAYEFLSESGEVRRLTRKLIERVKLNPKLRVRVYLEGDKESLGARNRETAEWLHANGVAVYLDPEDCTTHTKAVCVDDQLLLIGSSNLSNSSIGRNNETNVLIRSPEIAAGFAEYFRALVDDRPATQTWSDPTGTITLLPDASYFDALHEMIQSASESLDIVMYSCMISPKRVNAVQGILDALAQRAQRGVRVRALFDQSKSFSRHITRANIRSAAYLNKLGISNIHYDRPDTFTHAKVVVKDTREVLLGSTNWYVSEHGRNRQLNVLIKQPDMARWFQEYIAGKIVKDGRPLHDSFSADEP